MGRDATIPRRSTNDPTAPLTCQHTDLQCRNGWTAQKVGNVHRYPRGEYTEDLCGIIAMAFHDTADEGWLERELHQEPL